MRSRPCRFHPARHPVVRRHAVGIVVRRGASSGDYEGRSSMRSRPCRFHPVVCALADGQVAVCRCAAGGTTVADGHCAARDDCDGRSSMLSRPSLPSDRLRPPGRRHRRCGRSASSNHYEGRSSMRSRPCRFHPVVSSRPVGAIVGSDVGNRATTTRVGRRCGAGRAASIPSSAATLSASSCDSCDVEHRAATTMVGRRCGAGRAASIRSSAATLSAASSVPAYRRDPSRSRRTSRSAPPTR